MLCDVKYQQTGNTPELYDVERRLIQEFIPTIRLGYKLRWLGTHGASHWARVLLNGVQLCAITDADPSIVTMFSVFHDSRRVNDLHDPPHGKRGGALARRMLRGRPGWDEDRIKILCEACDKHTSVKHHRNVTIQTCWDADRLDLPRIGATVDRSYLGAWTDAHHDLVESASKRAREKQYPYSELFRGAQVG